MYRPIVWLAIVSIPLSAAAPLVRHNFETDNEGWLGSGQNGSVRIVHDAADVKNGKGALAFDYNAGHGIATALWPANLAVAQMRSLSFWLKTDAPTAVGVVIAEKAPGGNYVRLLWSPANTWQHVELQPADFVLGEGPNDPPDPDGKLDLDQIQAIGLVDVSQIFGSLKSEAPVVTDVKTGKHTMFIDDFEISGDPLAATKPQGEGVVIDDFAKAVSQWVTIGGVELTPENNGLRANFQPREEKFPIILRLLPRLDLRGWKRLTFDIASEHPSQIVISFEERGPGKQQGPRYSTTVELLGGGKVDHRAVAFSAFALDANGPDDPNGQLDLNQVKSISIVEIGGEANSIWIGNIRTAEKE